MDRIIYTSMTGASAAANRQAVLANNLANADTPGYKARDLDFDAALRAAGSGGNGLLASTSEQHYRTGSIDGLNPFQVLREGVQPSLDGNTVDPERARAGFAQAALEYRASMSFVESKVRGMLTAITGQ